MPFSNSGPDSDGVRLQKVLSQAGIASRRVAERMINASAVIISLSNSRSESPLRTTTS